MTAQPASKPDADPAPPPVGRGAGLAGAILFDCDGTLLLTSQLHFEALSASLARQGHNMPRDWYMALTGLGRRELFDRFAADFGPGPDLQRCVDDSIALTVAMAGRARENPSVAGLARLASGRVPIAVVTNSEAAIVQAFLAATGLAKLFDGILDCAAAPRPKPAPDLYLAAAARLAVPAADCLVLEDSDQGIAAARAAGMRWHDVRGPDWPAVCAELQARLGQIQPHPGTVPRPEGARRA